MAEALKIESLKLSERSSIEISTIKRNTKIETMNVICRWALTVSLSSDLPPPPLAKEDKILREIDWKIFAGDYEHLIMALLKSRMDQEKLSIDSDTLINYVPMFSEDFPSLPLKNIFDRSQISLSSD